jgi:hypothetical protein
VEHNPITLVGDLHPVQTAIESTFDAKAYDFHFSFGKGAQPGPRCGGVFRGDDLGLGAMMIRAKTEQQFTADPAEKDKPYFRVAVVSRPSE